MGLLAEGLVYVYYLLSNITFLMHKLHRVDIMLSEAKISNKTKCCS